MLLLVLSQFFFFFQQFIAFGQKGHAFIFFKAVQISISLWKFNAQCLNSVIIFVADKILEILFVPIFANFSIRKALKY